MTAQQMEKSLNAMLGNQTAEQTLCGLARQAGVDKWTCDFLAMTCTYFDRFGHTLHVE
jgi:uncharacterized protein YbcV (DUF1398 family)